MIEVRQLKRIHFVRRKIHILACKIMPILEQASDQDLKRLLELFPISNIREKWSNFKGTKEEICFAVACKKDYAQISQFLDDNLSCCRQHVYIFSHGGKVTSLPVSVKNGEKVLDSSGVHAVYVSRVQHSVVLRDPLEESTIDFLWPIRIDLQPNYLIVRFVVLEKNLGSYFDRPYYVSGKDVDEEAIIGGLDGDGSLGPADLHKGVKALWDAGFMDSVRVKYKKPLSTASEAMDEERGIRETNPELYKVLQEVPLFSTLFQIPEDKGCTVSVFSVDPSKGNLTFPRYSEKKGDSDYVINEILGQNG